MNKDSKGFALLEGLVIVIILGLIAGIGWHVYQKQQKEEPKQSAITNFNECVAAGNPVLESYPEQCTASGKTFYRSVQNVAQNTTQEGMVTFNNASHFDTDLKAEIKHKITDPLIYYETKVHKPVSFKGVIVDLGLDEDNKTRTDKHGYVLDYVYDDPELNNIGFTFGTEGDIDYWIPQLCDDGGCNPYPDDFKKKFPKTFDAYKKAYKNDPYYIR